MEPKIEKNIPYLDNKKDEVLYNKKQFLDKLEVGDSYRSEYGDKYYGSAMLLAAKKLGIKIRYRKYNKPTSIRARERLAEKGLKPYERIWRVE